jgi:hypothetical protein
MEPTLFGIGKAEWELYNSFSNWLSAIGTIAAVIISLHLARQSGKLRATVSVGHRIIITPGEKRGSYPEIIVFRLVNTGDRVIRVTQIGWKVGLWKKRYAVQMCDQTQSSPMPVELSHGQEASWVIPLDARDEPWIEYFANGMLSPNKRLACATLKAQFHTSIGEVFEAKPEPGLRKKFIAAKGKEHA